MSIPKIQTGRTPVYALLAVYGLLTWVFAYERILNVDNSYYFFEIINKTGFAFYEGRYGVWLTELPLLLALWMGAGLKSLVFTYSTGFFLVYALVVVACMEWLKSPAAALMAVLSLLIGVSFSFFHPVTETHQTLVLASLLFGLLQSPIRWPKAWILPLLASLVQVWTLWTHPVATFATLFVFGFSWLATRRNGFLLLWLAALAILVAVLRPLLSPVGSYDQGLYRQLFSSGDLLGQLFSLYPVAFLKKNFGGLYLPLFLLSVATVARALVRKQYRLVGFTLISAILFSLLTILTFHQGDSDTMMEKSFMPACFMWVCLLGWLAATDTARFRKYFMIIAFLSGLASVYRVIHVGRTFSARLEMIRTFALTHQIDRPKLVLDFSDLNPSLSRFNHWATAIDALVYTTCTTDRPTTMYLTEDKARFEFNRNDSNLFLAVPFWKERNLKELNQAYFKVPVGVYQVYENPLSP